MRGAFIGIIASLTILVTAQTAAADTTALQLAQQAAVQYWGPTPCQGPVTVGYSPDPTDATGPLSAQANWITTSTEGVYTSCAITINSAQFPAARQAAQFPQFCGLIVHEYSHFQGYDDEDDPSWPATSITNENIGPANEHVAPCVARYGQASGLALQAFGQAQGSRGFYGHARRKRPWNGPRFVGPRIG